MKQLIIFICLTTFSYSFAQVGIGTTTPNNSSILDIESTNKGVLFPRLTTTQKNAIVNPEKGLMIFDLNLNCLAINYGTPAIPDWVCQEYVPDSTIPSYSVSNTRLDIYRWTANYQTWVDVPGLTTTFTLDEAKNIKIDWTLFSGQKDASTNGGFAQMFTILEINNVNDSDSSNYLPMIHAPNGNNYRLLMNSGSYTYTKNFIPGTYTVKVRVYAASFLGSTYNNGVTIGVAINTWGGADGMTDVEKEKAASNKLIVTYL